MKQNVKVLLIEDDEDDALLAKEYLAEADNFNFEVFWEKEVLRARREMLEDGYDIFLIDYRLGVENGLDLVKFIRDEGVLTPSIILTGKGDLKVDMDASVYGAADYLVKTELNPQILERSIRYTLSQSRIIKELAEKEKKFRSLFERSIDPIFLATDKLEVVDVNHSFQEFFGYHEEGDLVTVDAMFVNRGDYDYFRSV